MKNENIIQSNNTSEYNYMHFKPSDYDNKNFEGPKAGEKYIDFEAYTLDGKKVSLSDYLYKPIVLETGSITCPMYANSVSKMNQLKELFPDVNFLLLYVREAHPGGKTKPTNLIEEKITNAKSIRKHYKENRKILVDTIDGNAHKMYGAKPNMTYVIGTDGVIKFRADWNNVEALKKVLPKINTDMVEKEECYPLVNPPVSVTVKTLLLGGRRALHEFIIGLPELHKIHKQTK